MNIPRCMIAAIAIPFISTVSQAANFDIFFEDSSAGINWSGVVDTTADTLSIHSWNETGNAFYVMQQSLPMIFNAVSGATGSYDIPDVWDGNLTNWGFLSENAYTGYRWSDSFGEIVIDQPNATKIGIGLVENYTSGETVGSAKGKGSTGFAPAGFYRSYTDGPTMSDPVNSRDLTSTSFTVTPEAVPEPSSAMLLLIGAAGVLTRRKR